MMVYLKNMAGFKMDFFKGMTYDEIRPIFEKHFNSIVAFLKKGDKEIEEEAIKRKSETSKEKAAKKQKLNEKVEELKTHLQIIPNDEDDVYTEATLLAIKVPVVDYQIHTDDNKPYYKIIRADGTHQLFLSFISLLRNFDREDLEMLFGVDAVEDFKEYTLRDYYCWLKTYCCVLNTQMSANDKFRLGYGDYRYGSILSYENEVLQRNYMLSGHDVEIGYSKFTYGLKHTSVDELDSKPSESASCESDSSAETPTSMLEPVESAPKVVCEPKVWTDAPIIEVYESDSDDDSVSNVKEEKETPSFAFTDTAKHVKSSRENVKETSTPNHSPKVKKKGRNSHTSKGLGYAFTRKACFVCGSFGHLIRDCDFHEKRMEKQAKLTKSKNKDDPHKALKDKGIGYSGCSKHMTGNKAHLADYQEFKGASIAFGELKNYNLFSVSQMCDKKNNVLFTNTDCLVLSPDFKLPDENQVLLNIPSQHNMYSFNLKNIDPSGDLSCLKESNTRPLVRPRQFSWVYFLKSKDETTPILKDFIRQAGNQFNHKVKTIRNDNGIEFKNNDLIEFCGLKGIKREYSNARTPQQNRVAKRKNMTFIEAARTMVLVTKPQNKTPYELLTGRQPIISYLGPFGCHVTILNTIDQLGKFDEIENQANKCAGPKEANDSACTQAKDDQGANSEEVDLHDEHFVLPIWSAYSTSEELEKLKRQEKEANDAARKETTHENQDANTNNTNLLNAVSVPISTVDPSRALNLDEPSYPDDPSMPNLEDIYTTLSEGIFTDSSYDDEGVVTDFNNLETTMNVSLTPTTRIHTIHPKTQILRDPMSAVQTRSKVNKNSKAHVLVWILVDLPFRKKEIRTKWVYRNKKDERGVVVRNKERLVAQGHRQEEGIDYDEVFTLVARIEAIRIFLAFSSYMGFIVYQMDVKSAFLYKTIDEEVYVTQPPSFVDPKFPNKVYNLYGLHQAPRAWYATLSTFLEQSGYRRGAIDKTLFIKQDKKDIMLVKQKEDGIFISQDNYVAKIMKKFDFLSVKTTSTLIETQKPLVKDKEAVDVDVTPKTLHLQAVKRIFRYLKGQLKLGLWYPKVSSFGMEAYSDSDYAAILVKGRLLEVTTAKHRLILPGIGYCCQVKELASPKQTDLAKDELNPLIVDSLLQTIWLSMHHVIAMKHWLFQSKRLL
nr:hypothetical protein [Tanacetum cinerariifolium]